MKTLRTQKLLTGLLIGLLLLVAVSGVLPGTALAQSAATPAATAQAKFDLNAVVKAWVTQIPDGFYGVAPTDALKALSATPKPFLVDLRDAKDFGDGGFIDGAVNIPLPTLTKNLDKLPAKDQAIIVYCGIGHRGGIALVTLRLLGYTNVRSISGGFTNWKAASLPVAKGTPEVASKPSGAKVEVDPDMFAVLDKFITALPADYYGIPPADALKALSADPKPFLLDVREPAELVNNGYIDGNVNIPLRKLPDNLDKLPKDMAAPIIDYCAIGHRGSIAMTVLRLLGYTNIKSISGGFNNWVKLGLPIVKPAPATAAATAVATAKP
jgi:rhodanese-related sulfurtransferase